MERKDSNQGARGLPLLTRGARGRKVLLVSEDPEALHYYFTLLQSWGYRVRACRCYEEGVGRLASEVFDLVVVSQGSRSFEGKCVLERALQVNRRSPVLVLARRPDMPCYLEAMQLGAADYLVEPFTFSQVEQVLKQHHSAGSTPS